MAMGPHGNSRKICFWQKTANVTESHINQTIAQNNYYENVKTANVRPISKKEEKTKHKNIDLLVF